jgi:hypothetical protein
VIRVLLTLIILLLTTSQGWCANRYARAAGGNWNTAATWASTDGGTDAVTVPSSSDDVFLTAISGAVTIDAASSGKSLNCSGYDTILSHGAYTLTIAGGLTMDAAMTYTVPASTSALAFTGDGTITPAGKTFGNMTFNGSGKTFTIAGAVTGLSASTTLTLTAGTLDLAGGVGGFTHYIGRVSSTGTGTRTLDLGDCTLNISGDSEWGWNSNNNTNMTLTAGTSTVNFTGASGSLTMGGGGGFTSKVFNNMNFTGGGSAMQIDGYVTIDDLTVTGKSGEKTGAIQFRTGVQIVSGTFTVTGASTVDRILIRGYTYGTQQTVTAANTSFSHVDFRDIRMSPAIDLSSQVIGDCQGNSGITFPQATRQDWSGTDSGAWSTNAWTTRVPLCHDSAYVADKAFASKTITMDMSRYGNVYFQNNTGGLTVVPSTDLIVYGDFDICSLSTYSISTSGRNHSFLGRNNNYYIKTCGNQFPGAQNYVYFYGINAKYTLVDSPSVYSYGYWQLLRGTLEIGRDVSLTGRTMWASGSATKEFIFNNANIYMTSDGQYSNTQPFDFSASGTTVTAGTSLLRMIPTYFPGNASSTFIGGGKSFYDLHIYGSGGSAISGSNRFNSIKVFTDKTIYLTTGTTQTVGNFIIGSATTLQSTTVSSMATINSPLGTYSMTGVRIKNVVFSGGATWKCLSGCTDSGGNTGMNWTWSPINAINQLKTDSLKML